MPRERHRAVALPHVDLFLGSACSAPRLPRPEAAGARRHRDRYWRRHELLDARHHGRGLQGRAARRPSHRRHRGFLLATLGGARALALERIASARWRPGARPTWWCSTRARQPLLAFRLQRSRSITETLAVLTTLGDDRAVRATYVAASSRPLRVLTFDAFSVANRKSTSPETLCVDPDHARRMVRP